ncbi:hypothetical protein [Aneurinibacillus tyrosinisolvens]|jgi:hypothetical protein|uniref:hypothetical protein n=1 Tax=Aneurinibacillus tyrosinisolvens TaxID=1443435 RepID=UPI000ACD26AE|nr:hypothetical protein [Aneurinibacillus tyrosinisolvens]
MENKNYKRRYIYQAIEEAGIPPLLALCIIREVFVELGEKDAVEVLEKYIRWF